MCCWLYRNGHVTSLRLIEDAAKEYCRRNPGYTFKTCREVDADRAARDMEAVFRRAIDFTVIDLPQDVDHMLEELHGGGYVNANAAPQTSTRLEPEQPEWYAAKRAEKNREWNYTRMIRAIGYDTHFFNCNELIRSGVYECKHFSCKCPCHQRAKDPRAKCLWLTQRGDSHDGCKCACHLTA